MHPLKLCLLWTSLFIGLGTASCGNNCSVSDDSHSGASIQNASVQAQQLAAEFPNFVKQQAREQILEDGNAHRLELQEKRARAEEAYKQAKERKEKAKPVPRAVTGLEPYLREMLPEFRHESLIAEYYDVENRARTPFFIRDGELTPVGKALISVLRDVDRHALSIEYFAPEKLEHAAELLAQMQEAMTSAIHLNVHELNAIDRAMNAPIWSEQGELTKEQFNALPEKERLRRGTQWLCSHEHTPVPRAAAICQRIFERTRDISRLEDALEFALADAWMAYAETMKIGNLEKFSDEEREKYTTEENTNEIHPKYHTVVIENRLAGAFEEFSKITTESQAREWLDDLVPKHDQYAKLQQLRTRYQKIVEDGGWATVPPDRMFAGGHAPLVKNLKKRLAVENYYTGEIDDAFDASLTAAIKKYQKHHQLEETGEVGDVFWKSLNIPATQRLAEIEVNIRRWHKTLFEPAETYAYINVPSFTVELHHQGNHVSTHKVVVGSSTKICNTRTQEWELMNSTRLMHARMTYLVFNPYWNVPPRIEVDEFLPKMAEDPKWLDKNPEYEYVNPRGGGRVLRQKPGPNNSLGRVKLIFPNRYNIYLHDTPKQGMFQYPVRAFSHGCMRVEKAMDFAREILEIDGQWDKKQVDKYLKQVGEHAVDLNRPIDVFIEYHTVTVDDEGAPYFLADVYRIIRDEITPPTALQRKCNPATDRTSQFRSGGGEDSGP